MSYAVGTLVTLQGTFKDLNGALVDPTAVEVEVIQPNRAIFACAATRASQGVYTALFTPTLIGGHSYKFQGTGNCQISAFGDFLVTGRF